MVAAILPKSWGGERRWGKYSKGLTGIGGAEKKRGCLIGGIYLASFKNKIVEKYIFDYEYQKLEKKHEEDSEEIIKLYK